MKLRLLDILACPLDKTWPLKIKSLEERVYQSSKLPKHDENTKVVCSYFCAKKGIVLYNEKIKEVTKEVNEIDYLNDCKSCLEQEIISGVILCPTCGNYYPIVEEIPMMLKAELRSEDIEREFTTKWAKQIKEYLSHEKANTL